MTNDQFSMTNNQSPHRSDSRRRPPIPRRMTTEFAENRHDPNSKIKNEKPPPIRTNHRSPIPSNSRLLTMPLFRQFPSAPAYSR
jgi:hypothetical protein